MIVSDVASVLATRVRRIATYHAPTFAATYSCRAVEVDNVDHIILLAQNNFINPVQQRRDDTFF